MNQVHQIIEGQSSVPTCHVAILSKPAISELLIFVPLVLFLFLFVVVVILVFIFSHSKLVN